MTALTASLPSRSAPDKSHRQAVTSALATLATEQDGLTQLTRALADPIALGGAFARATDLLLSCTGRVVLAGIGKSGHVARKIQSTLASTGTRSIFVHPAEAAHGDLGMIAPQDVLIVLSQSGETLELASILTYAARHDLPLIGITTAPESALARASRIPLILPRAPEACPMGLAPTTSTLMQMALGDALAIALLEARGFTPSEFGVYHPGGHLGAMLRPVSALMHTGAAMPLGDPEMPLAAVIMEMTRKTFGCMGVVDGEGALIGLITDGDLRPALSLDLAATRADAVMNHQPITVGADILVQDALRMMSARTKPILSVFVLDNDSKPVGIVHLHDLLRAGAA